MKDWSAYRRMLVAEIEDRKKNLEYAEKEHAKAKSMLEMVSRALESFDRMVDERLEELDR